VIPVNVLLKARADWCLAEKIAEYAHGSEV